MTSGTAAGGVTSGTAAGGVTSAGGGVTTGAGHLYPNFGHLFFEKYTPRTIESTTMTIMITIAAAPIYVDFENISS